MSDKGLHLQNIIALIWDFDKTLSPWYMQRPLFEAYGIDEHDFWDEVHALPAYYTRAGIWVQPDTCYLGHLLAYVREGRMPGLTNERLRGFGADLPFYPGVPEIFDHLTDLMQDPAFRDGDLHLEHYVVSTGIAEIIRGTSIADRLSGIWASEFIESPAAPGFDRDGTPGPGVISHIAGFLDHTTKTRAIFEINKGVNKLSNVTVNDMIPEEDRRVPVKNMIYIADGPSDIPSFSVVRKHGGLAYAVYAPDSPKNFEQVVSLHDTQRVDAYGPADYLPGSQTEQWLSLKVRKIAERIMSERKQASESRVGRGPAHIEDS